MTDIKILIVDDEPDILMSFEFFLKNYKSNLLFATSGNHAISILKNHKIDAVFSDFSMSDGSGIDLLRYITQHHNDIDFYFFTGNRIEHLLRDSLIKGIFNKPKDMSLLLKTIMNRVDEAKGVTP